MAGEDLLQATGAKEFGHLVDFLCRIGADRDSVFLAHHVQSACEEEERLSREGFADL